MGKNILVITGSPRKNGNSEMLADAFIKGAKEAGHETSKFEAAFKKIGPCAACDKCWSTGKACVINDDFMELEPLLEKADTIVMAFPLYWYSFPAQIKAVIDRLYSYVSPNAKKKLKIKESVKLVSLGDEDEAALTGLRYSSARIASLLQIKSIGSVYAIGVNDKGAIAETDYLQEAEKLGKQV